MTIDTIKAKIDKIMFDIDKRTATLERQKTQLDNVIKKAEKQGYTVDRIESITRDDFDLDNPEECKEYNDFFWNIWNPYRTKKQAVAESENKLKDLQQKQQEWELKFEQAQQQEQAINELPDILQELIDMLTTDWTEANIEKREEIKGIIKNLVIERDQTLIGLVGSTKNPSSSDPYYHKYWEIQHEFEDKLLNWNRKLKSYDKSDSELHKDANDAARYFVRDLVKRVKKYVGEITSWGELYFKDKALNGYVKGTKGSCYLETIIAGGMIQKDHYRVIIHKHNN